MPVAENKVKQKWNIPVSYPEKIPELDVKPWRANASAN